MYTSRPVIDANDIDIEDEFITQDEILFLEQLSRAVEHLIMHKQKISYGNLSKILRMSIDELQDYENEILYAEEAFLKSKK
jgi:hypothetical protein